MTSTEQALDEVLRGLRHERYNTSDDQLRDGIIRSLTTAGYLLEKREGEPWRRAVAAQREGARLLIGQEEGGWWATSSWSEDIRPLVIISTSKNGKLYPTPDEALERLLALLDQGAEHTGGTSGH